MAEDSKTMDAVATGRRLAAQVIWVVCALAALFLAVGALLVAVDANTGNTLVRFVLDVADTADLGIFDRSKPIIDFDGKNRETSIALLNWGLGALCWLIVGKVVDRVVRPKR